ncbi:copper type II ascorbate-dependent monooxygenase [Zopfochytrium polystomum]|nr:copper type II ascorbate-dependent monooxygenase [Zopfochytrium polystomum]
MKPSVDGDGAVRAAAAPAPAAASPSASTAPPPLSLLPSSLPPSPSPSPQSPTQTATPSNNSSNSDSATAAGVACHAHYSRAVFPHCELISPRIALHWRIVDGGGNDNSSSSSNTNTTPSIVFGVDTDLPLLPPPPPPPPTSQTAPLRPPPPSPFTPMWLALGISDQGGMRGADIWALQVPAWTTTSTLDVDGDEDEDGGGDGGSSSSSSTSLNFTLTDMYSGDYVRPSSSEHQDVYLLRQPRWVSVEVAQRPVGGGEHQQQQAVDRRKETAPPLADLELREHDIRMTNFTVPLTTQDTYQCMRLELPHDRPKYHFLRQKALVDSDLVHHMFVFGCLGEGGPFGAGAGGKLPPLYEPYDCDEMVECRELITSWSRGAKELDIPTWYDAGIAFGGGEGLPRYAVLQVHYKVDRETVDAALAAEKAAKAAAVKAAKATGGAKSPRGDAVAVPSSPSSLVPVVDRSGFRLYYTEHLRTHDLGFLIVGFYADQPHLVPNYDLPQTVANVCPSACLSRLDAAATTPLGIFFHMHNLGDTAWIDVARGGQRVGTLSRARHYDYGFQGPSAVPSLQAAAIQRGDSLLTRCTYRPTRGASSHDVVWEMCNVYVPVVPKPRRVEVCMDMGRVVGELADGLDPATAGNYAVCGRMENIVAAAEGGGRFFEKLRAQGDVVEFNRTAEMAALTGAGGDGDGGGGGPTMAMTPACAVEGVGVGGGPVDTGRWLALLAVDGEASAAAAAAGAGASTTEAGAGAAAAPQFSVVATMATVATVALAAALAVALLVLGRWRQGGGRWGRGRHLMAVGAAAAWTADRPGGGGGSWLGAAKAMVAKLGGRGGGTAKAATAATGGGDAGGDDVYGMVKVEDWDGEEFDGDDDDDDDDED